MQQAVIVYQTEAQNRVETFVQEVRKLLADGTDRLYQLTSALRSGRLDDLHKAYAEVTAELGSLIDGTKMAMAANVQNQESQRTAYDRLMAQAQDAVKATNDGRNDYNKMKLANAEFLAEQRHKLAAQQLQRYILQLNQHTVIHDHEMDLMRYQIDTENNLLIGLFGFVERREDSYPDLDKMTQLAVALGDAGGTQWLQP